MTARIYLAAYQVAGAKSGGGPCGSARSVFVKANGRDNWPYDIGDDPSFYAMRLFEGQLTWGICRQDVRNAIRPGDVVVFFSFERLEAGLTEYRFCAVATVERKVRHTDLWVHANLRKYRRYFNLLIRPQRPRGQGWEHFEPILEPAMWHQDWLWRIADHRGLRKAAFAALHKANGLRKQVAILGRPLHFAENYVLFSLSRERTRVLARPPVVARHLKGEASETWMSDWFSQKVKELTLNRALEVTSRKRSLRTSGNQRPHRHVVFDLPRSEVLGWRAELFELVKSR